MDDSPVEDDGYTDRGSDAERLRELEQKVETLAQEISSIKGRLERGAEAVAPTGHLAIRPSRPRRIGIPLKERVGSHLGGDPGQSLESRVGGIWLGRLGVIMLLTAAVLGARVVVQNELFSPLQRVAVYYLLSLLGILYGILARKRSILFPATILGAGLAGAYFTTYAAFFLPTMRLSGNLFLGFSLLILCLGFMSWTAHLLKSPNVAGMAIFLTYYTMAMTWSPEQPIPSLIYTAVAGTLVALVALVFHVLHRWVTFTWASIVGYYIVYLVFLWRNPLSSASHDPMVFWISVGTLALNWFLFSLAGIADARKAGEYRRGVAPMSGFNSFMYFSLSWFAVRGYCPEYEWMFRMVTAAALVLLTVLAETTGPRRNYLYQIFVAKTVIMFTLALQAYLSGEKLVVAVAIESLALAISYLRSGVITFKLLGHILMLTAFFGALASSASAKTLTILGISVPSNWFCSVGSALVFMITSGFYQHFVRHLKPEQRFLSGQWFLADTLLDLRNTTSSMVYAWSAALMLLITGIMDQGEQPWLPFLLLTLSGGMAVIGALLRTGQIDAASVLLLFASHLCYYAFIMYQPETLPFAFEAQPNFVLYSLGMSFYTFLGAVIWERYLRAFRFRTRWNHDLLTAFPHFVAASLLLAVISRHAPYKWGAAMTSLLGALLIGSSLLLKTPNIRLAGLLALACAAWMFYTRLYSTFLPLGSLEGFFAAMSAFLLSFVLAERLWRNAARRETFPPRGRGILGNAMIGVPAFLGLLGFTASTSPTLVTWFWAGFAVSAMCLGALFDETRYRWAGLALCLAAFLRAFFYDLRVLPAHQSLPVFLCLSAMMLLITWLYGRRHSPEKGGSKGQEEKSQ